MLEIHRFDIIKVVKMALQGKGLKGSNSRRPVDRGLASIYSACLSL